MKKIIFIKKVFLLFSMISICFLPQVFAAESDNEVVAIMYHDVTENPFLYSQYRIGADSLEEDIKSFKEEGYTFLKASEATEKFICAHENNKFVLFTFDDGYESFYTEVFPLLEKYDVSATFYILTSQIGKNNHLSEKQTAELGKSDLVEIGAHSHYIHRLGRDGIAEIYKGENVWDAAEDYKTSMDILEKITGKKVTSVSYPNGIYSDDIDWILKNELGVEVTISTTFGKIDTFEGPLNRINRDLNFTSYGFLKLIDGLFK